MKISFFIRHSLVSFLSHLIGSSAGRQLCGNQTEANSPLRHRQTKALPDAKTFFRFGGLGLGVLGVVHADEELAAGAFQRHDEFGVVGIAMGGVF